MRDISDYTLVNLLDDVKNLDIRSIHDYVESIVVVMKLHYEKKEFDNEIIKESQSKDMAVMDYILESYQSKYKN